MIIKLNNNDKMFYHITPPKRFQTIKNSGGLVGSREKNHSPCSDMCNYDELRANIRNLLNPKGIFCMEMKKSPIIDDNIRIKSFGNKQVIFWSK